LILHLSALVVPTCMVGSKMDG